MATTANLGRIQGGGFFGSTAETETDIPVSSVMKGNVNPLIGDTIVNFSGALCRITSIGSTAYSTVKYGRLAVAAAGNITYREGN